MKNLILIIFLSFVFRLPLFGQSSSSPATYPEPTENTVSVKPSQLEDPYAGQPIVNNVFYDTDLRQAMQDIAAQSGASIIVDNSVQGYITMEIKDLPLEKALSRILSVGGFTFKKIDDYYLVGAADPKNAIFGLLSTTASIKINYLSAAKAIALLSDFYRNFVKANEETNAIVVTASPEMINKITADLRQIDIPPRQVMIEAVIAEINNSDLKSFGIDWRAVGAKGSKNYFGTGNLSPGLLDTLNALFSFVRKETAIIDKTPVDIVTSLRALATTGKTEIKANPKIVTTNAQPASIYIAKEQYFSMVTGPLNYPYTKLEQVSVGIKLEITPFISENDEITVKIKQEVSDASSEGREGLPLVDKRMVTTNVRVRNGETITIGGLTQHTTRKIQNKVPLLGSIPLLGYLFSHTKYQKIKTDIVVFITPKIIEEKSGK